MTIAVTTHPAPSQAAERVLSNLKGVKRAASGWIALCPAHDDKQHSLSVGVGGDGRAVLKCHAGCPTEGVVAKLGLAMSDLFAPKEAPTRDPRNRPRMVKSYDYTDEDGNLLFQTCRFEPKTFRQRRPDGNDGWIWSLGETQPVLYQLPKVLDAVSDGKRVFVVEGEKDADTLTAFGYTATTSPMGAGKWKESYSELLKGADVVILPDNDDAGRSHAEQIAASLTSRKGTVKVVALPGLPPRGDVSDWLAVEANDLDAFEEIVSATPRWSAEGIGRRSRFRLDELWENDSIMRPPPPLVPRLAWAGRSTLLAAREKSGKSTLICYVAAMVTQGKDFLGQPCAQGDVVIFELEEYAGDTARRLRHFGADAKRLHIVTHFLGDPHERPQELLAHIDAVDPLLVIVDSLAAYCHGFVKDDNSATEMTAVVQPLTDIAHQRGVGLILAAHARKSDGRARGSTAITAATDIVCEFWAPDEDADPRLRRMRSAGRVPLDPFYDFRFIDGDTYVLDTSTSAPLDQRVLEFIRHHDGTTFTNLRDMVTGRFQDLTDTVGKLIASGMILPEGEGRAKRLHVRN